MNEQETEAEPRDLRPTDRQVRKLARAFVAGPDKDGTYDQRWLFDRMMHHAAADVKISVFPTALQRAACDFIVAVFNNSER